MTGWRAKWRVGTLAGVILGGADAVLADALPRIEPLDACFVEPADLETPGVRYQCGHVIVPENRSLPDGRTVGLGYMRVSKGSGATQPPLFMIAGGPGNSLIQPAMFYMFTDGFLGPILEKRDIVVLEQRGARYSDPHLDCPEARSFAWKALEQGLDPEAAADLRRQAIPACAQRVAASGVDLAQYDVGAIVEDIDDSRRAFGFDRIALYGASYGAQIAQQMIREHPDALAAVILDGANSLSPTSWVQDRARDADEALDSLDTLCEADIKCAAAYDLRGMVDQAMALFKDGPIWGSVTDPTDPSRSFSYQITEEDFAGLVFELQTGQVSIRSMPALMQSLLADGRTSMQSLLGEMFASEVVAARNPAPEETATLAHAAVVCSDDPVTGPADITILPDASAFARAYAASMYDLYHGLCTSLALPVVPPEFDDDATGDVPTLVLAGALDARTPLFRSEEVASKLTHARLAVFPEGTHVQLGEVNTCAAAILRNFLDAPRAVPDLSCIDALPKRGFILPDGSNSTEIGP